jgi:hypothetical protein
MRTKLKIMTAVATLCATAALSGCGTTPLDRGVSGAGIGAAAGAIGGAVVGAPGTGAAIGAAIGGAAGALTDPDKVDLGRPVWK